MSDQGCLSRRTNRLATIGEGSRTRRARAACRFSQTANAFGCGPRRHLPSALRRTGATRSGLASQLPATDRTKKLVRVSPAETSHYERRRRNAADHVSRSSLGARLVQADAGAGQGFRHLQCGSRKALPAAGDNRPARAGGDFRAQIHLTLVTRRASANRNLNGRFWESREAAAGRYETEWAFVSLRPGPDNRQPRLTHHKAVTHGACEDRIL